MLTFREGETRQSRRLNGARVLRLALQGAFLLATFLMGWRMLKGFQEWQVLVRFTRNVSSAREPEGFSDGQPFVRVAITDGEWRSQLARCFPARRSAAVPWFECERVVSWNDTPDFQTGVVDTTAREWRTHCGPLPTTSDDVPAIIWRDSRSRLASSPEAGFQLVRDCAGMREHRSSDTTAR